MIYTCYEMIRDCRADRPEGWSYFIAQYIPVIRKLLTRYDDAALLDTVLVSMRQPGLSMFESIDPAPERWFVAQLRQKIQFELPVPKAEITIDLETVAAALESLTMTEKQATWIEAMRYTPQETGAMLRMAPATVEKILAKSAGLLRGRVDSWRRTLLVDNGLALSREAAAASGKDCLPVKAFMDVIDGRSTWLDREQMERHVNICWHCIDRFCRFLEVAELMRGIQPLSEEEAAPFRKLLGIEAAKRPAWKRLIGAR
jgi:hypothetical protein